MLTTPGFWPDGVTNSEYPQSWNQTVLSALKSGTQCVIVHYYPGGSSTAGMLTDPSDIAGIVSTLHSEISSYAGISNPASVPIIVTETNSTIDLDTQPAALFGADMYMTWLENGVANVDWWNEHNGEGTVSTVDGATDYGDQGIFSNNTNYGGTTEPAVDTPFAPYYGLEMLSKLAAPGDTMVTSTSSQSLLRVHAVRDAGGNLNVLIDNEDPSSSYTVSLGYSGFTPSGTPTVYTLANNGTSITSGSGSASSVTVGAYSLTVVHIPGSGGSGVTAPGAPGQPTVFRPVVQHLQQHVGHRDDQLARRGRRDLPDRHVQPLQQQRHAGHVVDGRERHADRPDHRQLVHLRRGGGRHPGQRVAAFAARHLHRPAAFQRELRGALRGERQLVGRLPGRSHDHQLRGRCCERLDTHLDVAELG